MGDGEGRKAANWERQQAGAGNRARGEDRNTGGSDTRTLRHRPGVPGTRSGIVPERGDEPDGAAPDDGPGAPGQVALS